MDAYIKAVYKILQALEKSLDNDAAQFDLFSAEHLGISQTRWLHYLLMLQDAGYITGVVVTAFCSGDKDVNIDNIAITLKGLEYLAGNSIMQHMFNLAKDVKSLA